MDFFINKIEKKEKKYFRKIRQKYKWFFCGF
jgi:hypothetical protein